MNSERRCSGKAVMLHPGEAGFVFHSFSELTGEITKRLMLSQGREEMQMWKVPSAEEHQQSTECLLKCRLNGESGLMGEILFIEQNVNYGFDTTKELQDRMSCRRGRSVRAGRARGAGIMLVTLMEYISIFSGCDDLSAFERGKDNEFMKETLEQIRPEDFSKEEWDRMADNVELRFKIREVRIPRDSSKQIKQCVLRCL